ncbi:hypothetical protein ACVFI8_13025 [Agarivorans sp. MS3-6]
MGNDNLVNIEELDYLDNMIVKPIYELLPSMYIAAGSSSVLWTNSTLGIAGGGLLFCLGAIVWVMRSNFRRQDQAHAPAKRFTIPESLYEFIPFFFIAVAITLLSNQQNILGFAVALICLYRGASLLYLRHRYRQQAWQHVKTASAVKRKARM